MNIATLIVQVWFYARSRGPVAPELHDALDRVLEVWPREWN